MCEMPEAWVSRLPERLPFTVAPFSAISCAARVPVPLSVPSSRAAPTVIAVVPRSSVPAVSTSRVEVALKRAPVVSVSVPERISVRPA